MQSLVEIDKRTATGERKTKVFTGRKTGIKITFVSLFWFHRPVGRLCAPIIVKFGRDEEAPNTLLTAKVENFRGSFGEFRPKKTCKKG